RYRNTPWGLRVEIRRQTAEQSVGMHSQTASHALLCHLASRKHERAGALERSPAPRKGTRLLDLDLGASFFELLLQRFGISLRHAFFHSLRSAVDQVFGFLQAQAGGSTHNLDGLDLLLASSHENDVKLGLLFD